MAKDPVCGMEVPADNAAVQTEYEGKRYYFCSEGCREKFLNEHSSVRPHTHYELIVIGGGPAGLTAAVYAATTKIDTLFITKDLGGQAIDSTKIRNYMGYDFITGPELVAKFKDQLLNSNFVDHLISEVEKIEEADGGFWITLSNLSKYWASTLIIATGMTRRSLDVEGEDRFQRKGVFYGNIQDYSFVSGNDVVVVGGGNSALQLVEDLHTVARSVHVLSKYDLTADAALVNSVRGYKRVTIYENVKVLGFEGRDVLERVVFRKKATDAKEQIAASGVFIAIGMKPDSGIAAELVALNDRREIVIDRDCSTSSPGIIAAGDVTNAFGKRIIIASGEGAKAALAARQYLLALRKRAEGGRKQHGEVRG